MAERVGKMVSIDEFAAFLGEYLGVNFLPDEYDKNFAEFGIDSLRVFTLIDKIEEKYNVCLMDENLYEYDSVTKLYTGISQKTEG